VGSVGIKEFIETRDLLEHGVPSNTGLIRIRIALQHKMTKNAECVAAWDVIEAALHCDATNPMSCSGVCCPVHFVIVAM